MLELFQDIKNFLTPPKWDSWQTLIWISVFSWALSFLATDLVQSIIAACGWVFLIPGLHWWMHEDGVKKALTIDKILLAPWITGALICYFLFGSFESLWPLGFIVWPPLSAIISALPKFIAGSRDGPVYKLPDPRVRQDLLILFLLNLLFSCWFQFNFVIQTWLSDYPDLLSQDLSRSPFVVRLLPHNLPTSRGVMVLDQAEALLRANLEGRSWSEVESWLFEIQSHMPKLQRQVLDRLSDVEENAFWQVGWQILPGEYNLQLQAIWTGPTPGVSGYYLTKSCQITKLVSQTQTGTVLDNAPTSSGAVSSAPAVIAQVRCGPVVGPTQGQPELVMQ